MDRALGRARWLPFALALLVSGWTLGFDYVHDDFSLVKANADLARGDWAQLATAPLTRWMGRGYPYYRPLAMLSYAVDEALFGAGPTGHHAVNVLLHGLCALLVCELALALGEDRRVALTAGCLFALHPAHAEAVAWISARADLLATLAALGAWVSFLRERKALALGLFATALASKESAAALPLVMLLCGGTRDGSVRRVAPCFAVALAWLVVRGIAVGPTPLALRHQLARVPPALAGAAVAHLALEVAGHLAGAGVGRLDFTIHRLGAPGGRALALAAALLLAGLALADRRRDGARGWGLAALALFAPLAGLLLQPGSALLALRYLYLPSALVVLGLARATARVSLLVPVALGLLFGVRLIGALGPFADAHALWAHEVAVSPGWSVAHGNLGLTLAGEGDPAAGRELTQAVALARGEGRQPADALLGLARIRMGANDLPGAAAYLEEAYRMDRNFPRLAANLGFVYLLERRPADARPLLEQAVAQDPADAVSRANLDGVKAAAPPR